MMMKKFFCCGLLAMCVVTAYAKSAPGVTIQYQKHYACSWVYSGTQAAPDMYIGINPTSGALSAQRAGYEPFYARPTGNKGEWLEINPEPADNAPQLITLNATGTLRTFQGDILMSQCIEVD